MVCPPWNATDASVPGVEAAECALCGASVVISASSRETIARIPGMAPVCATCMEESAKVQGQIPMMVTPEIRQELIDRSGLSGEAIDELIEYVRSLGPEEAARMVREFHERGQQN